MSIAELRRYPGRDDATHAAEVATMKTSFAERVRTHGVESARALLATFGVEPSFDDIREATSAATRAEYVARRETDPWTAARIASSAPEVYKPDPAPPQPSATAIFLGARARVASSTPPLTSAQHAWAEASKTMIQTGENNT